VTEELDVLRAARAVGFAKEVERFERPRQLALRSSVAGDRDGCSELAQSLVDLSELGERHPV
jgi:hypothetical protein